MIGANTTVSIYKIINGVNTNTYPATATYTGVEAYLESLSANMVQVLGEQHNIESFDMYIDPIDIDMGDKVVDASNREYRVTGVERHENNPDCDDLYRVSLNSAAS